MNVHIAKTIELLEARIAAMQEIIDALKNLEQDVESNERQKITGVAFQTQPKPRTPHPKPSPDPEPEPEPTPLRPTGKKEAPLDNDNSQAAPLSEEGIRVGNNLQEPFTNTDLQARLDGDIGRAYSWVAAWKRKGWIDTVSFGTYRRTKTFGE
jgi:hypothetical protein